MSTQAPKLETAEVQGETLGPTDQFWLETARDMARQSVPSIEEASKQVIAIASLSQTIYFAAVSFADVKAAWSAFSTVEQIAVTLVLLGPLVCWMLSLFFSIRVFKPERYPTNLDSPDMAKDLHHGIVIYKKGQLQQAYYALVAGFCFLIIAVAVYFMVLLPVK